MADDPSTEKIDPGTPGASGMAGPKGPDLGGFKSSGGNSGNGSRPTPKKKGKIGRPSHRDLALRNGSGPAPGPGSGPSSAEQDEAEANREELEALLREMLVLYTNDASDYRYLLFQKIGDDDFAKMLANKKRLTDTEKKLFPKMVVRLAEKYIGESFEFSDEIMTAAMALNYILRNLEGDKLEREMKRESDKRSNVQTEAPADPGDLGHRENGTVRTVRSTVPGAPQMGL